ncbi:transposase [Streptomyces desertarenae]|uniref:Transposase n=1 Tax=Streptomyces desertarenae TaxID=2666184 RepID=A0ABW4PRU3_9ACTN
MGQEGLRRRLWDFSGTLNLRRATGHAPILVREPRSVLPSTAITGRRLCPGHHHPRRPGRDGRSTVVTRGRRIRPVGVRHPVHRSKAVRAWLEANADRIELHLMPGYSPELNPDEPLNADLKRHTSTPRVPAQWTTSPTRPDDSSTAASANPTSSAATSTPDTSAIRPGRQLDCSDSMSVFRVATGRVTGWPPATQEAPVPLREVFDVSTHRHRSLVGSVSCLTRPASHPGRVGNHAHRHP